MGWLQNRPQVSDPVNYYTLGLNRTVVIVGLGNPGSEYDLTRHNIGFEAIDNFVDKNDEMEPWILKKDLKCLLSSGQMGSTRVLAIKPTTFMNLSGEAVQAVLGFYKLPLNEVVVVHDELDVDFGNIRLRKGGSSAGHNGLKSIIESTSEDFGRVRIGIGPKQPAAIKSEAFVLKKFSKDEQAELPNLKREVNSVLSEYIYGGQLPNETRNFIV